MTAPQEKLQIKYGCDTPPRYLIHEWHKKFMQNGSVLPLAQPNIIQNVFDKVTNAVHSYIPQAVCVITDNDSKVATSATYCLKKGQNFKAKFGTPCIFRCLFLIINMTRIVKY